MKATVHYYAILRDKRGVDSETVETSASTPSELWEEMDSAHPFGVDRANFAVAVDDAFASWDDPLRDGCQVVFLPPVSGG